MGLAQLAHCYLVVADMELTAYRGMVFHVELDTSSAMGIVHSDIVVGDSKHLDIVVGNSKHLDIVVGDSKHLDIEFGDSKHLDMVVEDAIYI